MLNFVQRLCNRTKRKSCTFIFGEKEKPCFSINVIAQLDMLMEENKLSPLTYIINKHSIWRVTNIAENSNVQKVLKRMQTRGQVGRPRCELKAVPK